jgi:hypothetical protein
MRSEKRGCRKKKGLIQGSKMSERSELLVALSEVLFCFPAELLPLVCNYVKSRVHEWILPEISLLRNLTVTGTEVTVRNGQWTYAQSKYSTEDGPCRWGIDTRHYHHSPQDPELLHASLCIGVEFADRFGALVSESILLLNIGDGSQISISSSLITTIHAKTPPFMHQSSLYIFTAGFPRAQIAVDPSTCFLTVSYAQPNGHLWEHKRSYAALGSSCSFRPYVSMCGNVSVSLVSL